MKNIIKKCCIFSLVFVFLFTTFAYAVANVIKINGVDAPIPDGMGTIKEMDGRTFVPLRFVSEYLKNSVSFDEETKTVCVASDTTSVVVQSGSDIMFIITAETSEVVQKKMDTAAFIDEEEGRTYVPIRFLAEAFGYDVGWNEDTQVVTLDKK